MAEYRIDVIRTMAQQRSEKEVMDNLDFLAHLPRGSIFDYRVRYDAPRPEGLLWVYQGSIIYYTKRDEEKDEKITREMKKQRERVKKACAHSRWGRTPWSIIESGGEDKTPPNGKLKKFQTEQEAEKFPRQPHASSRSNEKEAPELPPLEIIREVAEILKAASNATRIHIVLFLLDEREPSVGDIVAEVEESQPNVSHHLRVLRDAKLVQNERDGQFERYQLTNLGFQLAQIVPDLADDDLE